MVGIGGRSRGCHTCRRRRVKCDEAEPSCQRCTKAGLTCEGYMRGLIIVDEKKRAQKLVAIRREAYLESVRAEEEQRRLVRHARQARQRISLPLSQAASLESIQLCFTQAKMFTGVIEFIPWIGMGYREGDDTTSTHTLKAVGSMFYGRIHRHQPSVDIGFKSYSKALQLLSKDLGNPKALQDIKLLTNCQQLYIFEMVASSASAGFIQHGSGVQRIIEFRGPEAHQTNPALQVFESARLGLFHVFLEQKRRSFLEQQRWQTIPWRKHPEAKTLLSSVIDRLCFLPGMLEDMEALRDPKQSSVNRADFAKEVYAQTRELYLWRARWEIANSGSYFAVPNNDPSAPFRHAVHFKALPRAFEIIQYNICLFLLFRIGYVLVGNAFAPSHHAYRTNIYASERPLLLPSDEKTVRDIALDILRMVEYHFLEEHKHAGALQILFPLRVIIEVFKKESKEWDYSWKTLRRVSEEGGMALGKGMMQGGGFGRLIMDEAFYN